MMYSCSVSPQKLFCKCGDRSDDGCGLDKSLQRYLYPVVCYTNFKCTIFKHKRKVYLRIKILMHPQILLESFAVWKSILRVKFAVRMTLGASHKQRGERKYSQ